MKLEQFRCDKAYGAGVGIAGHLLRNSLISPCEYRKVKAALIRKYRPTTGSLPENPDSRSPAGGRSP